MKQKTVQRIVSDQSCMGCGLCEQKCPKGCIAMQKDHEGFFVPVIDTALCVNCGVCLSVCPATERADPLYRTEEREYFCSIIADRDMLVKSSSGGTFGILADDMLARGGYVVGCVYNDAMQPEHVVTNIRETVVRMYGSKYVQSRAQVCFPQIKELLAEGHPVLFTGTACQIAALRIYLGGDHERLFCVEILCHGVPSPDYFATYVRYLEKKLGGHVLDVQFRNKEKKGWGSEHRTCVIYEKKGRIKKYRPTLPAYFSAFFYGLNLRESCYKCRFATEKRIADLTIGDYWGSYVKYGKRFDEGISVASINSQKGKELVERVRDRFAFYETLTRPEAVRSNDNFEHPIKRPRERSTFYRNYEKGYRGAWRKAYFSKTYRKKTLASFYGAFIPAKIRFALHKKKKR